MQTQLICSKAELYLPSLPAASIDAMITDPPAGIGFMGKNWDKDRGGRAQWIAWMAGIMHESLRIAKPSSYALVWALPRTSHWTAYALEDAGWQIRDIVTHLFGSGWPKSKALLKPASEHWILCKAPGALEPLNIDDCRVDISPAGHGEGGRWPSNLLLSHHPDCVLLGTKQIKAHWGQPTERNTSLSWYGKNSPKRDGLHIGYADASGMEEMQATDCIEGCPIKALDQQENAVGASRFVNVLWPDEDAFLYQAKASKSEKTLGGRIENPHPTVKSIALMRWLTKLIASPGDTILDPFMGTGTGGIAALERGCSYIGIDEDPLSVEIAAQRMDGIQMMIGT